MIKVTKFIFNDFRVNSFILNDDTKDCIIIDAGCNSIEEEEKISGFIKENQLNPVKLLNTHGHVDHIFGNRYIKEKFNIPIMMHENDVFLVNDSQDHAMIFGYEIETPPGPDLFLSDNDIFQFGNSEMLVLHTPGHSPGGICLYSKNDKFVIAGDTLFFNSIGRTDLPGGCYNTLLDSIKTKLFTLPDNTKVYSGHGNETSIGYEKIYNPFLNGS